MTLKPGDIVIDYSYSRPLLTAAAKAGAKGVIRYSAGLASDPGHPSHNLNAGKLISPAEHQRIRSAGLDVIANDEWYETRVAEGYSAGLADGAAALKLWRSCGHARGASIYSSWDTYPTQASWVSVGRYVAGFRKALGGYYDVDAYAGTGFLRWAINHVLIKYGWRPNAGSWSNDGLPYQPDTSTAAKRAALVSLALKKTPAHLWQTGNYWFGKSCDENLVVRVPVGSHNGALEARKPVPVPDPVPIPNPTNDKELQLTPEDKAYLDAKFKAQHDQLSALFSGSDGKPHLLRTWLTKLKGSPVDVAK